VNGTKDNRLSRIYREGAWPEPSRQIDQAILSASRRAARGPLAVVKRWAPSFAIAATVLLTSALVLKVYEEQPEAVSPTLPEKVLAPGDKQPPSAAEEKAPETKAAPAQAPKAVTTPSGFSSTMDAGEAERLERLQRDLALRHSPIPTESPAPPPNYAPPGKPAVALKKETPEANRAADALLQRRPDATQALRAREAPAPLREQRPVNAPVSVFGATPPAAAVPPPAPASPVAPAPAPAVAPAPAATSGAVTSALSAAPKAAERSPQAWVEDIRKLMAAGKSEEAGAEIAKFKKRYPDYVLPEDLR
jgi:hypothetical protein